MLIALLLSLAFATPEAPDDTEPASGDVLTIEFLQRIPTGARYPRAVYAAAERCTETLCSEAASEIIRRPWALPEVKGGGFVRPTPEPDPLDVLPTGRTVAGVLRMVRGVDPRDPLRIAGATPTVILDGAVLMPRTPLVSVSRGW